MFFWVFDEFSVLGSFCFNGFELFFINMLSFMYVLMDVLMNFLD